MPKRDPSRGVGWGAGWTPPPHPAQSSTPAYSYRKQSPGFTELVVSQAWKFLIKIGAQEGRGDEKSVFGIFFVEKPSNEREVQARAYFEGLQTNERAALTEIYESMEHRVGCF